MHSRSLPPVVRMRIAVESNPGTEAKTVDPEAIAYSVKQLLSNRTRAWEFQTLRVTDF